MTVKKVGAMQKFIGASTDTKPTGVAIGSTFLEYDSSELFTTYDGTNWVQKKSAPFNDIRIVRAIKTLQAASIYNAGDVMSESISADKAAMWTFLGVTDSNGGAGIINWAQCLTETNSASGDVILDLYLSSATCNLLDHASNTSPAHSDVTSSVYLGRIWTNKLAAQGTTGDAVVMCTPESSSYCGLPMPFVCGSASNAIYGIAICPTAMGVSPSTDMMWALEIEKR